MTYQQFYDVCNDFIDKLDTSEITHDHRERMRAGVLSVMAFAADRQRRGEAFE
jgi:hypothetical protein